MKLERLYTNAPDIFLPIEFNPGLSIILAEIRRPENQGIDTHNLGKTTVGQLIDFCLLRGKSSDFFLYKHASVFHGLVFFLSFQANDGRHITVARNLEDRGKIAIHISADVLEDANGLDPQAWTHVGLPFTTAKKLLDGLLNFRTLSPWDYRDILGYLVRDQTDYSDVFQLRKFRGKHSTWKPFLSHLLGLDASLSVELYEKLEKDEELETQIRVLEHNTGFIDGGDVTVMDGLIAIRRRDISAVQEAVDSFNFAGADDEVNADLVERIEEEIASFTEERYRLSQLMRKLDESLQEERVYFRTEDAQRLFSEVGVAFGGQLKRDFDQLLEFNREITNERRAVLTAERAEIETRLASLEPALTRLQDERATALAFMRELESFQKYKSLSARLIEMKADLQRMESTRDAITKVVGLRQERRALGERIGQLQTAIEKDVQTQAESDSSVYSQVQKYFDEIVHYVIEDHALLTVRVNSTGSLDFFASIVNESGTATSAARGHSYNKLLCIAFDLAIVRIYSDTNFPRFVFHDGVFETLDPRKKRRLVEVLRRYADAGLQPVITSIDTDLPDPLDSSSASLHSSEVVRLLHDDGQSGRLFNLPSW